MDSKREGLEDMSCILNERCSHSKDDHYEGACWFITQTIFKNDNTDEKYCICKTDGNIRLYKTKGFMIREMNDLFITQPCAICKVPVLLRANETICMRCKDRPENYEPVNPTEFVRAAVRLNKPNQKKS